MNLEGVFLKELADEKIVEKAFDKIDRFNNANQSNNIKKLPKCVSEVS